MFKPLGQIVPDVTATASPPSQSLVPDLPAERDASGLPVMFDQRCDREIIDRVVGGRDVNGRPTELRRPLTMEERMLIEGRCAALHRALEPYGPDQRAMVEAEVAAMLSGFRAMRQHGDDALAMIEVTCAVLREFPLWAIGKACRLIATRKARIDGRGLDERFAPNDAEIYAVVEEEVRLYRRALDQVRAVLEARIALPPAKRPSAEAMQANEQHPAPPQAGQDDGRHARRVADDLAMRKACKDAGGWIGA